MTAIVAHPQFENDVADAARAYERTLAGTGRAFINETRKTLWNVSEMPEFASVGKKGIYRAMLVRFPYFIVFRKKDDRLAALAVLPTHADPGRLIARISRRK